MALITAIFLWFFVVGVDNTVSVFPEPLQVEVNNANKNISIASTLPQAKIYVKGDKEVIKNISKSDFSAYVDITDKSVGEHRLPLFVTSKNSQVVVVKVEPKEIDVKLAPLAEKEVEVKLSAKGEPKDGYKVEEIKTEITKVKIAGAQPILDAITNVTAELILDGTETSDISRKVTLSIPEMKNFPADSLQISPNEVQITATIIPEVNEKEVAVKPAFKTDQEQSLWLSKIILTPSKIRIKGNTETLKNIEAVTTSPINAASLANLTSPLALELSLPANVTLADPAQKVFLSVTKESIEQKSFSSAIRFNSTSGSKLQTASTYNVSVTLKGPASILQKLKKEDLSVELNLDLAKGTGNIPIVSENITLPGGLELVDFQPKQIQVELSL